MPRAQLPFHEQAYFTAVGEEATNLNVAQSDVICDDLNTLITRPQLIPYFDGTLYPILPSANITEIGSIDMWDIDTLVVTAWDGALGQYRIYVGDIFGWTEYTGHTALAYQSYISSTIYKTQNGERFCLFCNGADVAYIRESAVGTSYDLTLPVPTATFVPKHLESLDDYVLMSGYIPAGGGGYKRYVVYRSDFDAPTTFNALNFFAPRASSDNIQIIKKLNRDLYIFGAESIEIWRNDGSTPFSRIGNGVLPYGCESGKSVVRYKEAFIFLDRYNRVVLLSGRQIQPLSQPITDQLESVSNLYGSAHILRLQYGDYYYINVLDSTFVFDLNRNRWFKWGYWDSGNPSATIPTAGNEWNDDALSAFPMTAVAVASYTSTTYIGTNLGRTIYAMLSNFSPQYDFIDPDIKDDSMPIRFYLRTGWIDHGTRGWKISERIMFKFRRGDGIHDATSTSPKVYIRWRDNDGDASAWKNWHTLDLGASGDGEFVLKIQRPGRYRARQYEMYSTDNARIYFISAEEDYEVIG